MVAAAHGIDATLAHVVEDYLATTPPCTGSSQLVGLVLNLNQLNKALACVSRKQ
jgi:hypothetical protein